MDAINILSNSKVNDEDTCLTDSAPTHTIFQKH